MQTFMHTHTAPSIVGGPPWNDFSSVLNLNNQLGPVRVFRAINRTGQDYVAGDLAAFDLGATATETTAEEYDFRQTDSIFRNMTGPGQQNVVNGFWGIALEAIVDNAEGWWLAEGVVTAYVIDSLDTTVTTQNALVPDVQSSVGVLCASIDTAGTVGGADNTGYKRLGIALQTETVVENTKELMTIYFNGIDGCSIVSAGPDQDAPA